MSSFQYPKSILIQFLQISVQRQVQPHLSGQGCFQLIPHHLIHRLHRYLSLRPIPQTPLYHHHTQSTSNIIPFTKAPKKRTFLRKKDFIISGKPKNQISTLNLAQTTSNNKPATMGL
jgi:hypothetical protein